MEEKGGGAGSAAGAAGEGAGIGFTAEQDGRKGVADGAREFSRGPEL